MNTVTRFGGQDMALVQRLTDVLNTASRIDGALSLLDSEVIKASDILERVVVKDDDSFGRATALAKSMSATIKTGDGQRKAFTDPLKDIAAAIKSEFDDRLEQLTSAKNAVSGRADKYASDQAAINRAKAEDARRAAEEVALSIAQSQEAAGNASSADQTLALASKVIGSIQTEKVKTVSVTGATAYSKTVIDVSIADHVELLKWLIATLPAADLQDIAIPKSLLNRLAAESTDKERHVVTRHIPGLHIAFRDVAAST